MTLVIVNPQLVGVTTATTIYTGTTGKNINFRYINVSMPSGIGPAYITVTKNDGTNTVNLHKDIYLNSVNGGATMQLENIPCNVGDIIQIASTVAVDVAANIWEYN
jgi:hypothetical protein